MKDLCIVIFCGVAAMGLSACSSPDPEANSQTVNVSRPVNVPTNSNINSNVNSIGVTEVGTTQKAPISNGETTDMIGNAEDASVGPDSAFAQKKAKMEAMRNASGSQPKVDEKELLRKASKPAPDNSEFAVILAGTALEVRTFKSHPQLLKVEKRHEGEKSFLKVYLRNGQVIDLPGAQMPSLGTESAARILEISGVAATSTAPSPNAPAEKPRRKAKQ